MRSPVHTLALGVAALAALLTVRPAAAAEQPPADKPNVIFILADDLGVGDLGAYGGKKIKTPNLDRMAAEGLRFTQAYCGTSVCAPSRAALMTGLHMGHSPVRANREMKPEGQFPLPAGTYSLAHLFKDAGYATACVGKWGLGFPGSSGEPKKMGIDHFFGYNCQRKAHEYFPPSVYRNDEVVQLDGKTYTPHLMDKEATDWIRANRAKPFFFYYAMTLPHGKFEIDDLGQYKDAAGWTPQQKTYAAMVSRMDAGVGRVLDVLKELRLDERTLVVFASDNGAAVGTPEHRAFFDSTAGLRGIKRSMYEGGLRVPLIARWPGKVSAGATNDTPTAFYDALPTFAELTGQPLPAAVKVDGISVAPALFGKPVPAREYLYWELYEGGFNQAVRFGDYKAVRTKPGAPVELYDLKHDPAEATDLAATQPEAAAKAEAYMKAAHVPSPEWPVVAKPAGNNAGKKKQQDKAAKPAA